MKIPSEVVEKYGEEKPYAYRHVTELKDLDKISDEEVYIRLTLFYVINNDGSTEHVATKNRDTGKLIKVF